MTTLYPVVYDSTNQVLRPMANSGETLPTNSVPLSAQLGNSILQFSDGLYSGTLNGLTFYVDSAAGSDTNAGTKASPFQTIQKAATTFQSLSVGSQINGQNLTIVLKAGLTYSWNFDLNLYGGSLTIAFFGDSNYGDFNSGFVNGTTDPAVMANLNRPIINPSTSVVSTQNYMNGINLYGASINLRGVSIQLPGVPGATSIGSYGGFSDFIRVMNNKVDSGIYLSGAVINMTSTGAYWGLLGLRARSTATLTQFASQLQISGLPMSAANTPTSVQLGQRQYFIKFYADYAGNNQNLIYVYSTSSTSSTGSGILKVLWSDTEQLTVSGSNVSQASFPLNFQPGYGLSNYFYGSTTTQNGQTLNVQNSRLMS